MNLKIYKLTMIISLVISMATFFIDYRISLGVLLASVFSLFNMFLLSMSMKSVMDSDVPNTSLLMGANIIRFTLLGLLIFVAIKNPQLFNIVGVTIGLTLFLLALLYDAIKTKRRVE